MKIALIDGSEVLHVWAGGPEIATRYTLPNGAQVSPICLGWADGAYSVVEVVEGEVPEGHRVLSRSYAIDDGKVVESVTTEAIPPYVPETVSMRQARLAMLGDGILVQVEQAIAGLDDAAQIEWEYATEVRRDHPLIAQLASALELTESQVDDLFVAAEAL